MRHQSPQNTLVSVQYIRAVAATLVVVAHAAMHPLREGNYLTWLSGAFGVTLFFVISGFIMVRITGDAPFDPWRFIGKRILRIVPLYWLVTLVVAAIALVAPALFKRTEFDAEHVLASLLFIPMRRPSNPEVIEPLVKLGWTLNYEMFFYVVFACLAFCSGMRRVLVGAAILVGLVVLGRTVAFSQAALVFYTSEVLIGFAGGMMLGALYLRGWAARVGPRAELVLLGTAALAAFYLLGLANRGPGGLDHQLALTIASVALIAWAIGRESAGVLPRSPALLFLGDASYSIYLTHIFGVGAVTALGHVVFPTLGWASYVAIVALNLITGLAVGSAVYLLVERPMLRLLGQGGVGRRPVVARRFLNPVSSRHKAEEQMEHRRIKVLAIASGGGHWEQLVLLLPAFTEAELHLCCTSAGMAERSNVGTVTIVPDCNRSDLRATLASLAAVWSLSRRVKPDVVVSTGAAPGALALAVGKLRGARVVWIDSVANAERLSMSGKLCALFADLCLTQWPHLAKGGRLQYAGAVL